MSNQLYPSDLTDRQWEYIKDIVPPPSERGRRRTTEPRQIVNGILYILTTGAHWRSLPISYPPWPTVYHYFQRWQREHLWERLHGLLRTRLRQVLGRHKHPTAAILDSQTVKSASQPGERGYDAAKHVRGRKRHVLVDTNGLVIAVHITPANVSDSAGARQLLLRRQAAKRLSQIWVDGGYKAGTVRWALTKRKMRLVVVPAGAQQRGFVVRPRRWVVERTFAWLLQARRLRSEYEVLVQHSKAFLYLAMTRLMLRRLVPK